MNKTTKEEWEMTRKRVIATLALVALVIVVAAGAAVVPAGTASNQQSSGNQLAGTWIATVNRPAPLPPVTSLQVYTDDGSFVEWGNDSSGAERTAQFGTWERIGGRLYAGSGIFFRSNPVTGAQVGSMKINRTLRLSEDGQSFTTVARVQTLDLSGNVVASFVALASGVRMQIERIAEEP
jgi:hypothetical protein